MSCEKE